MGLGRGGQRRAGSGRVGLMFGAGWGWGGVGHALGCNQTTKTTWGRVGPSRARVGPGGAGWGWGGVSSTCPLEQ